MTTDLAVLVLGDMLAAGCDDLGISLSSRDARRLAPHVVELLGLAGWELITSKPGRNVTDKATV